MQNATIDHMRQKITAASLAIDRQGGPGCSWGARMPWLPIRQDPRLLDHLCPGADRGGAARGADNASANGGEYHDDVSDRSAQCRFASLSTLASTNASLRELMLGASQQRAAAPSLLEVSIRAIRRELMCQAFQQWAKATAQQSCAPRYFRCGDAGQRYGVLSELSRGLHGRASTRVELAVDVCNHSGRDRAGSPRSVVLKVYKWLPPSPADTVMHDTATTNRANDTNYAAQIAERERAALCRCEHPHVLNVVDYFVEESDHALGVCAAETLDPFASVQHHHTLVGHSNRPAGRSQLDLKKASTKMKALNRVIVLEHAPGGSLDQYLKRIATARFGTSVGIDHDHALSCGISVTAAVDLCTQLFSAVAHCHSPQIATAHRDIKPANCLLFPARDPHRQSGWLLKLSDFGLAKTMTAAQAQAHNRSAETFTFDIGTEPYQSPEICGLCYHADGHAVRQVSPELAAKTKAQDMEEPGQADGDGYNPFRSDLWSLGCTVYEICTLKLACRCAPDAAFRTGALLHVEGTNCQVRHEEHGAVRNDDICGHGCCWLKQATIPLLPPPPLFAEEFKATSQSSSPAQSSKLAEVARSSIGNIGVEINDVRNAVDEILHGWSCPTPGLRPPVASVIADGSSWDKVLVRMDQALCSRWDQPIKQEQKLHTDADEQTGTSSSASSRNHSGNSHNYGRSARACNTGASHSCSDPATRTVDDELKNQVALVERWSTDVQPADQSDFSQAVSAFVCDSACAHDYYYVAKKSQPMQTHSLIMSYNEGSLPAPTAPVSSLATTSLASTDTGDDPNRNVQQEQQQVKCVRFGGAIYTLLPFALTVASTASAQSTMELQSAKSITTMESELRGIYCPAELAELEMTLLSQLFTYARDHPGGNMLPTASLSQVTSVPDASQASGDVICCSDLEDRIVWHLVRNVLVHRRADYARRVDGLKLFVQTGFLKTYAAQGYHLQPLAATTN